MQSRLMRSRPRKQSPGQAPGLLLPDVWMWQIVLQKPKIAPRSISRHKTNQPTTGDLCSLKRVTEVAREFVVRR
jgi:hypothetical protein